MKYIVGVFFHHMKRCLACNAHYASEMVDCPTCGAGSVIVDGYCAYAPELAHAWGGFKSSSFAKLARLEDANFWFRSRNQLII